MARPRAELPPPLPPGTRTVGQLVGESLRLYSRRFWPSLALGLPVALDDQVFIGNRSAALVVAVATSILLSASYAAAATIAAGVRPDRRALATALAVGVVVYVPFSFLVLGFVLPGVAWLAFVGLAVPVAVVERLGFRDSLARATRLARADYAHALGSLATLTILFVLARVVLFVLLRGAGEATDRVAVFLADLVISPVVFLGAALLYFDQAARVVSSPDRRGGRRRDADLHSAVEPEHAGRPDPEVEPRPATRG